jgi:hypothetical protein
MIDRASQGRLKVLRFGISKRWTRHILTIFKWT